MRQAALALLLAPFTALAQGKTPSTGIQLPAQTALPIVFTSTIAADHMHSGDAISAKTIQTVRLANGVIIPSGARVSGHVIESNAFVYDRTPYAKQKNSTLTIHFDNIDTNSGKAVLNVTVRALADVFATEAAYEPKSTDLDPLGTRTLVGGELLTPSQDEIRNMDDDVVAYNRRDGVYAHLIPNGRCDGGSTEVSMGIFSASACGQYGYTNVSVTDFGSVANPSTLTLTSHRTSPAIMKHSTALLEVLPQEQAALGR